MQVLIRFFQRYIVLFFLLYMIVLVVGSLWPRFSRHYQTGEISSGLAPKEGDNFKMVNNPAVYRLDDGKRRQYKNEESFFIDPRNKPYDTPYEKGGILICDKKVVLAIPMGDYMPLKKGAVGEKYQEKYLQERLKEAIFRKDKVAHFIAYGGWAVLLMILLAYYFSYSFLGMTLIVLVTGTLFGGVLELLQFELIPGRDKEWLDLLFNTFGLLGGILIYSKVIVPIFKRFNVFKKAG